MPPGRSRESFRVPAPAPGPGPTDTVAVLAVGGLAACALSIALLAIGHSAVAAAIPALLLGTAIAIRWPHLAIGGVLVAIGFEVSLTAFFHLHVAGLVNGGILVLWLAAAWTIFHAREERPVWLWPGLLALSLYPLVTLPAVLTADTVSIGFDSFKLTSWHLLAFLAVAVAPWPAGTYRRISKTVVAVALAVAAYSAYRKFAGPAAEELAVARANVPGLPHHIEVPFFGGLFTAQDLATWCAVMIPACTALALAWRGPWRLAAILASTGSAFVLLESDRRAAFVGAVAGTMIVLALFALSARAYGGRRLAITLVALGATISLGAGIYAVTVADSPDTAARFEGLFNAPTQEESFQIRQTRWDVAIDSADEHPFGVGLGHVGAVATQRQELTGEEIQNLDSSYLKIAYEQGFPVMALFAFGVVTLFFTTAIAATRTSRQQKAALGIAACGTLGAMAVVFYTSFFIESLPAVAGWLVVGVGAGQFCKAPVGVTARSRVAQPHLVRGVPRATPRTEPQAQSLSQ